jgi:Flp pilus assembly protein TadG
VLKPLLKAHNREEGQMAITMVLVVLVIVAVTALSFDTGVWYFDHRTAQNQAEAAALAAVLELPAKGTQTDSDARANALAQANFILEKNGSDAAAEGECPTSDDANFVEFQDLTNDGKADSVTVCVRRQSPGAFSSLSGIDFVHVSASATARTGPVNSTNVMPWAVVAPDPTCTEAANRNCIYDANGDNDTTDAGDCNAAWTVCPFGITGDRLYTFKEGTGGNTGIIAVCGSGADQYRDCLAGDDSSGFFQVGQTVQVTLQPGTIANATDNGLQLRDPADAWDLPGGAVCDVAATPLANNTQSPGYDPDGKAAASTKFVNPTSNPQCVFRLVPIPIVTFLPPNGSADVVVLGFASFGVARWNSTASQDLYRGSGTQACFQGPNGSQGSDPPEFYKCGVVWGYIFTGVTPPDALLNQIGNSNNPFAPNLVALVD